MSEYVGIIGLRSVVRDEKRILNMLCPECGQYAEIDSDQFHGRVSIQCTTPGCRFHQTINLVSSWSSNL